MGNQKTQEYWSVIMWHYLANIWLIQTTHNLCVIRCRNSNFSQRIDFFFILSFLEHHHQQFDHFHWFQCPSIDLPMIIVKSMCPSDLTMIMCPSDSGYACGLPKLYIWTHHVIICGLSGWLNILLIAIATLLYEILGPEFLYGRSMSEKRDT